MLSTSENDKLRNVTEDLSFLAYNIFIISKNLYSLCHLKKEMGFAQQSYILMLRWLYMYIELK